MQWARHLLHDTPCKEASPSDTTCIMRYVYIYVLQTAVFVHYVYMFTFAKFNIH